MFDYEEYYRMEKNDIREDNWAVAKATVEAAVFTLASQMAGQLQTQQADRLLACWQRLERG